MSKESNQHTFLPSHRMIRIIDAIFNCLNLRLSEKGGLRKHSYLKYALMNAKVPSFRPLSMPTLTGQNLCSILVPPLEESQSPRPGPIVAASRYGYLTYPIAEHD